MINEFYKNFELKDYLEENLEISKDAIDCTLGVNPLIDKQYMDPNYSLLKNKIIEVCKEDLGIKLLEKNISFGSGTMGIIRNLCTFLLEKGDVCIGIAPQFSRLISEVELQRAKYRPYYLEKNNNYQFCVESFLEFLEKTVTKRTKMIYIDNPNNPTGQFIDIKDVEKILRFAKKKHIYVLIDEAYGDYMDFSNFSANLISKFDNLIVLKSASKVYGLPADRIGYVIASSAIIEVYNKIMVPFPFSEDAMYHFIEALDNRSEIWKTLKEIKKLKEYIVSNIPKKCLLYTNKETPIFTIYSDKYDNLQKELLKNNLYVESCAFFEGLDEKFVRVRVSKEKEKIVEILNLVL